jgi:hypothetical protein
LPKNEAKIKKEFYDMSQTQTLRKFEVMLPDVVYEWFLRESQLRTQDISSLIRTVLEQYVQQYDLTQTRTWQLCGAFTVAKVDLIYLIDAAKTTTNYAENVDQVLYSEV